MTGYEATVLTSIILDELAERAMRHPDFSRYAYDLTDLTRQMRYAARMRQVDLGSVDVDAAGVHVDMADADIPELFQAALEACSQIGNAVPTPLKELFQRWETVLETIHADQLFSTEKIAEQTVRYYCSRCGSPLFLGEYCPVCNCDDGSAAIDIYTIFTMQVLHTVCEFWQYKIAEMNEFSFQSYLDNRQEIRGRLLYSNFSCL